MQRKSFVQKINETFIIKKSVKRQEKKQIKEEKTFKTKTCNWYSLNHIVLKKKKQIVQTQEQKSID